MFELHVSMPPMQSTEYQAKILQKFPIIIHNYANVSTINQSKSLPGFWEVVTSLDGINGQSIQIMLRGENDSKQSNEIQATRRYVLRKAKGVQKVDSYNYILYKVQPPEVHIPSFPCVMLVHYCLLYSKRCNHLKYTHLSFHV